MPTGAAFFDLDKTLMEGSSALHFGRAAYRAGLVSRRQLVSDAWANIQFRLKGSTDESTKALWNRILESIAGTRVKDLERLAPDMLSGVLPRLYPEMLEVAYGHQDAGRPVYIVTAASHELSNLLATVLAFDGGIGMRTEIRDGVYTGRPDGPFTYREGKAQAIREVAEREDIDLAESYAYSDSESDLPMLRTVGHPVVVNPDAELARVAREEGWQVIRIDKLARRLRLASAVAAAGLVAAGSGYAAARVRPSRSGLLSRLRP
jgi:HAD superfamily hydrolase (TIGR01490 family)